MLKKIGLAALLSGMLMAPLLWGQSKVGTTAAPFLTIGVGSRPMGMGGAFVSLADDANALYWNPAGLARLQRSEVVLVHTTWLADMKFDYVGAAFNLGQMGTLGAAATLLNAGEMEVTTETQQEGTGIFFNSYDLAVAVTYSYMIYDAFTIGTNVKYIHQQIWHETADGIGIDLGVLLITPLKGIRLGVMISNFGTEMKMEGKDLLTTVDPDPAKSGNNENVYANLQMDSWQLPLTMRVGISGEPIKNDQHRFTLALDWVHPNDNDEFVDLGGEYAFCETVALRAGYKALRPDLQTSPDFKVILSPEDSGGGVTLGGGLRVNVNSQMTVKLDYAFESFDRLGNTHKYSLGFTF